MSRIEKAIEIAARKRTAVNSQTDAGIATATSQATAVAPVGTQSPAGELAQEPTPAARRAERLRQRMVLPVGSNPCLVMANAVDSPAAEQYRKLKSAIVKMAKSDHCGQTLMITSPMPGEGKSVTALNLAISLAQEFDHTVLLVEADLRKPSLLQYLGLQADVGLSDCVLDGLDIGAALVETGIEGLTVLPAGRTVNNPVELFSSNRMQELFAEIKSRNPRRFVIIDTTPLLPFAEPQYIANVADGVVLVVRERMTSIDKIRRALEILKNHNLLGVVSNCVSLSSSLGNYYGYSAYRYEKKT